MEAKDMHCRQNYYLQIAARAAMNSVMTHKHGAVIVYKKNIIAMGHNYHYLKHSIHAEIAAIHQVKRKDILADCEMYVVRVGPPRKDNYLLNSKPCQHCQDYICKMCIKRTFYSTSTK